MTQEFTMTGGRNIAMKIPPHQYEATVRFYRDVVGLKPIGRQTADVSFEFGANRLWIDRVPGLSQAEIWLEIATSDASEAAKRLEAANVVRCDEIRRNSRPSVTSKKVNGGRRKVKRARGLSSFGVARRAMETS